MDAPLAPTEPLEMLGDLLGSLRDGHLPSASTREWFDKSVLCALRDDVPLDRALRLVSSTGGRSGTLARQVRLYLRDQHLLQALELVALDAVGTWQRCVRLAAELERFMRADWPAYECRDRPAEHWSALRVALWSALRVGVGVPTTAEGLYRVTKQCTTCLQSSPSLKVLAQHI